MGKKSKNSKRRKSLRTEAKIGDITNSFSKVSSKESAEELLDKANEYMETFEYDLAGHLCKQALDVDPLSCRAHEMSGLIFLQADDIDLAKINFRKAVELQPDIGHEKYMYLGQLSSGVEAVHYYLKGIELMNKNITKFDVAQAAERSETLEPSGPDNRDGKVTREVTHQEVSLAYCSIAEIFLTDSCFEEDADIRCQESLNKAIAADPGNAEAYHLYASYWLSKDDNKKANESINRGISLWLPQLQAADEAEGADLPDPTQVCAISYPARINCSKMLIELENYEVASEILEHLLDEDDQFVEVWYLLGWLNYLRGEGYKTNARHYLQKGQELAQMINYVDEQLIGHMNELLMELEHGNDDSEQIEEDREDNSMTNDDLMSESEEDEKASNH